MLIATAVTGPDGAQQNVVLARISVRALRRPIKVGVDPIQDGEQKTPFLIRVHELDLSAGITVARLINADDPVAGIAQIANRR